MEIEEIKNLFKEKIQKNFSLEKRYGFSLCGPQKDDFLFILNGHEGNLQLLKERKNHVSL